MKKLLLLLCTAISFAASSQVKQTYNQYGGLWKRLEASIGLRLPLVTTGSSDLNGGPAVGDVYYNTVDSSAKIWTGSQWLSIGVVSIPTLQQVFASESNNAVMTGNNKMTLNSTNFNVVKSATDTFFKIDPVNRRFAIGDVGQNYNATALYVDDVAGRVQIDGTLRYAPGSHGAGKFLTSDVNGDAFWTTGASKHSFIEGSYILNWQTTPRTISGVTVSYSAPDSLYSGTGTIVASGNYRTTSSNDWEMEILFSPSSTVSGTVAINITSTQSLQPNACIASINLGTSTLSITNGGSSWTQSSAVTAVSAGDALRIRVIFYHNTLKVYYENISKSEVVVLNKTRPFGYLSGAGLNDLGHTSGTPGITLTGVTNIKVYDWKFKDNTRGQIAWVGGSIIEGYAASAWDKTYGYKIDSASYFKCAFYGKAGMNIRDLINNRTIDNLLLTSPTYVIIDALWYNDQFVGETLADTWARMKLIREKLSAHNIQVIWLGASISSAYSLSLNDSIQTHYPNDPFWNLNSFLSGSWASPDGAHPNDLGHQQMADSLMIRLPFILGKRVGSPNKVDTLWRTAGVDSIYFKIEGTQYAIKDSVGTGGGSVIPSTMDFRLTTESGVPVSTTDRTAQGTIYMTPYKGNHISLYSGAAWVDHTTAEISLALTVTSGNNYDVFVYNNAGTITLELSAAWTNDNTRADALTRQDGVLVKSGATTRRWIGTIRASGSNVTEDSKKGLLDFVGGKRFVWNAYNQVMRTVAVVDSCASGVGCAYGAAAWRQLRANTGNKIEYVSGDASSLVDGTFSLAAYNVAAVGGCGVAIGVSSTTTPAMLNGPFYGMPGQFPTSVKYIGSPGLGYFYLAPLEHGDGAGGIDIRMATLQAVITN